MTSNNNSAKIAVLQGIAAFMLEEATRQGASDCELSIKTSESVDTSVRHGVVEQLEGAQERGVSFKAYVGQKSASAKSSDFRRPALRKLIKSTIALANASEADPFAGLVDKKHLAKKVPDLDLYDPAIAAMSVDSKIRLAIECEAAALAADPRITNSSGASFSDGGGVYLYANSRGFIGAYPSNYCSLNVSVVATDPASPESAMQTNGWHSASRTLAGLETPAHIGAKAASRAIRQLGAKKVKSQVVPVVFDPQMAGRLLAQFVGATKGTSIDRKTSFLLSKLGQVVAAAGVNVVDDPTMPGKLGSKPFDGEGLALKRRHIVKDGKLETYLVDGYAGPQAQLRAQQRFDRQPLHRSRRQEPRANHRLGQERPLSDKRFRPRLQCRNRRLLARRLRHLDRGRQTVLPSRRHHRSEQFAGDVCRHFGHRQ